MDMEYVRITASLLAPRIRIRGTNETHYLGILNRNAWNGGGRAWGPIGGAATVAAFPKFGTLALTHGVSLWDPKKLELRLRVPMGHVSFVLDELEIALAKNGENDIRTELYQELTGKELHRVSRKPILTPDQVDGIDVRYLRSARQPRNGGYVNSQRVGDDVLTKRLLGLCELLMSREIYEEMRRSTLIREFNPDDLPGADDLPAEPIQLGDGTELRGHLVRIDD